ncbi:hypothetical protein HPB48_020729 [Haemaphysalis longicornis]|uniref:Uncharacterized protein n=1 Tax=Haemaphysalis longicornis TaxID=44386 RepID=A0A9J6GAR3_HAELO|nr:hypothetical protein HPB48_020729 [Haemaphysalis longicornis]
MRQLFMVLWKNIYLKRLSRHLVTTVLEIVLMVVLLLGIQDDAVVREPFLRKGDTIFRPIQPTVYWNTQKDMADITTVTPCLFARAILVRLQQNVSVDSLFERGAIISGPLTGEGCVCAPKAHSVDTHQHTHTYTYAHLYVRTHAHSFRKE